MEEEGLWCAPAVPQQSKFTGSQVAPTIEPDMEGINGLSLQPLAHRLKVCVCGGVGVNAEEEMGRHKDSSYNLTPLFF